MSIHWKHAAVGAMNAMGMEKRKIANFFFAAGKTNGNFTISHAKNAQAKLMFILFESSVLGSEWNCRHFHPLTMHVCSAVCVDDWDWFILIMRNFSMISSQNSHLQTKWLLRCSRCLWLDRCLFHVIRNANYEFWLLEHCLRSSRISHQLISIES